MRAVAAVATVAVAAAGVCNPDYDCKWTHIDKTGKLYDFDFSVHCRAEGYAIKDSSNRTYHFNVCGNSPQACLPKSYTSRYQFGAAVQIFSEKPYCNTSEPATLCTNVFTNATACCTGDCEVLGVGTPIWTLIDPNNPATGGVSLKHTGVGAMNDDPNRCPADPETGDQRKRSVTITMFCNAALPAGRLGILDAYEQSPCEYVIETQSAAACGCAPNCVNKNCGSDGCGGYCSGKTLMGFCPSGQLCKKAVLGDKAGVCCRPDCTNRDCGDDGCGGSCGVCGADETCSAAHVCLSTAPLIPQAPVTYGSDSAGLAGSFFGGAFTAIACAGVAWFVRCGGRARFDRWRFAGGEGGGSGSEGGDASSKLMSPTRSSGATAGAASSGSAASAPLGGGGKFTTYGGV